MPIDRRFNRAQGERILARHRPRFGLGLANHTADVRVCRVNNWHRVAFRKHEAIRGQIPRILRVPAHLVIHQHRHQMRQR